jgi:tRNA A37 threonylcarbamoyladenosine dehydratase
MNHYYEKIHGWFTFSGLYSKIVNKFPNGSHFVEVGSWMGKSAVYMGVEIVNSNKKIKFDCVDNWEFADDVYDIDSNISNLKVSAFQEFLKNIEPLSNIITYHKLNSTEASNLYDDESLDFVFLDASHEYENVKSDLIHWYPKIKYGGIIAGHDYCKEWNGVVLAVNEFFKGEKFEILKNEGTWVYAKNREV